MLSIVLCETRFTIFAKSRLMSVYIFCREMLFYVEMYQNA